jgi:hypothetical protein
MAHAVQGTVPHDVHPNACEDRDSPWRCSSQFMAAATH